MRRNLLALFTLAAIAATPALADSTLVWQGQTATGVVHIQDQSGNRDILCYPTLRMDTKTGDEFYTVSECPTPATSLTSIGFPSNGPPINMKGITAATSVSIDPKSGKIILK